MKKTLVILLVFGVYFTAHSTIYRVNNNAGVSANFSNIQAAHDSAASGDTIYLEASAINYGDLTISKKLNVIGPGYFLTQNPETQSNPSPASLNNMTFQSGAAGSFVSGCSFVGRVVVDANNIIFKRNRIACYGGEGIQVNQNRSNIMILQNYLVNSYYSYPTISVQTGCSNLFIMNNYLENSNNVTAITVAGTSSAVVTNNTIKGHINATLTNFNNNIMISGTITCTSCSYNKNIGNSTQFPNDGNNMQNVDMLTVFDSTNTSIDGKYQLSSTSPAIGYGLNGDDCGMFGGIDPYVLSGVPAIPAIYYFNAPSSGSSSTGLPVHIRVKSRK